MRNPQTKSGRNVRRSTVYVAKLQRAAKIATAGLRVVVRYRPIDSDCFMLHLEPQKFQKRVQLGFLYAARRVSRAGAEDQQEARGAADRDDPHPSHRARRWQRENAPRV